MSTKKWFLHKLSFLENVNAFPELQTIGIYNFFSLPQPQPSNNMEYLVWNLTVSLSVLPIRKCEMIKH